MLATTAFHTSSISNMPLYFFPPLLLFLYLFPRFSLLIPFLLVFLLSTYLLPSLSSLPLLLYHHHIFLHPFSSLCPSSHLFFNHVLQIPPSLIHFLHAISPPPPLRLTPPPSPHSLFIHSFLLVLPFFFLIISPLSPFLTFLLVPSSSPSFISTPFCCLNLGLSIWSINLRNR